MAEKLGSVDGARRSTQDLLDLPKSLWRRRRRLQRLHHQEWLGRADDFRINPQSGLNTGGEAAQAIYEADIGHSFVHKGNFEISSIYPRAYRGVAGASSRNLFKNGPGDGRHLLRKPQGPGHRQAGLRHRHALQPAGLGRPQLEDALQGHKLQAIGDTPRERTTTPTATAS